MKTNSEGNPSTFSIKLVGRCTSGITSVQGFNIPDTFSPFRTLTLKNPDVSEIISSGRRLEAPDWC